MILAVKRAFAIVACLAVAGCTAQQPIQEELVLPSSTGAVRIQPLRGEQFAGTPTRIGFEPVPLRGGDFMTLMDFAFLPDSTSFLAVTRAGKVGLFDLFHDRAVLRSSFQIPAVYTQGTCGASSIAIDPEFDKNNHFYVSYCIDAQYGVVKRFTYSDEAFADAVYSSANIVAAGDQATSASTNAVGALAFAPDGTLWVNMGDRGNRTAAADTKNELGAVLRLIPQKQQAANGYTVPRGNPFSSPYSKIVYAYGLRNPWRGAFDSQGRYWVADVGADAMEEIDVVTKPGQNFGWPDSEGNQCRAPDCTAATLPVLTWDHLASHAYVTSDPLLKTPPRFRAAWVGTEYLQGSNDPYKGLLTGKMLYGDFYAGFVRGVTLADDGTVEKDVYLGHLELPVAWRQAKDGYLYAGTMYDSFDPKRAEDGDRSLSSQRKQGQLWRVVPLP